MKIILRAIQLIEQVVISMGILLIALLSIINVIGRSLFNRSLASTEELSQFLVVTVTFVGLSYAVSQGRHIRMTAFYDALPRRLRKALVVFICGTTAALMFYLAYEAFEYAMVVRRLGSVSPTLQVPLYRVYLVAPLGFGLAGLRYSFTLARNLTAPDVYLSYTIPDGYAEQEKGVCR